MTPGSAESQAALRRMIYALLIVASAATAAARIFSVESASGRTPFLGANDRSRWSTVRALVDHGTYAIDDVIFHRDGRRDRDWYSIDIVRHQGRDGREHYYSTKPPLLATGLAGAYWIVRQVTGATFESQPFYVARLLLLLANVAPLVVWLWTLSRLVEEFGESDWGRIFVMASAAWGTYLTTLATTLNNHLPAAACVGVAIYAAARIWRDQEPRFVWYPLSGLTAALAVANELPALAFFTAIAAALGRRSWRATLSGFAPAAAIVAMAAVGTNYLAHDSLRPPYAHRNKDGALVTVVDAPLADSLDAGRAPATLRDRMAAIERPISADAVVTRRSGDGRWTLRDEASRMRYAIERRGDTYAVRLWDDWYEFEGSYWSSGKYAGVDRGEPSRATYAFHMLFGHHGLFSLTPIWLLSAAGAVGWLRRGERLTAGAAALTLSLTLVCAAFYVARPLIDRNYGGVSCGFRWLFWLIPLWLLCLLPACDRLSKSPRGRIAAMAMLGASVFSAVYPGNNPWTHPWLFDYWTTLGWIEY